MKTLFQVSKQNCKPCENVKNLGDILSEDFLLNFEKKDYDTDKEFVTKYEVTRVPSFILVSEEGILIDKLESSNADAVYLWVSKNMMTF